MMSSIPKIGLPDSPPPGFDPRKETDDAVLAKYGYLPRFEKQATPKYKEKWEAIISRGYRFVKPNVLGEEEGVIKSKNWSGAQIYPPPSGTKFGFIYATWDVPDISLPSDAKVDDDKWRPGTYRCPKWIGFDGTGEAHGRVIQTGTGSIISVDDDGEISAKYARAWFEWYPHPPIGVDFQVKFGDIIDCFLWGISEVAAVVWFFNSTSGEYTSFEFGDEDEKHKLTGDSAEWIVEDTSGKKGHNYFPDYGTTTFYTTEALSFPTTSEFGFEVSNLTSATLCEIPGKSTPVKVGPDVLQLYAYDHKP